MGGGGGRGRVEEVCGRQDWSLARRVHWSSGAMAISIEFVGAAQTVTGSMHLVRSEARHGAARLRDVPGPPAESLERNQDLGVAGPSIDAVVLSHAHIDHSGALPSCAADGYARPDLRDAGHARSVRGHARGRGDDPGGRRALPQPQDRARARRRGAGRAALRRRRRRARARPDDHACPYHRAHRDRAGRHAHLPRRGPRARQRDLRARRRRRRQTHGASSSPATSAARPADPARPRGAERRRTCSSPRAPTATGCTRRSRRWRTSSPRCCSRTHERGGKVIIPSFALERAQEVRLRAQEAATGRAASRRCRSTSTRR